MKKKRPRQHKQQRRRHAEGDNGKEKLNERLGFYSFLWRDCTRLGVLSFFKIKKGYELGSVEEALAQSASRLSAWVRLGTKGEHIFQERLPSQSPDAGGVPYGGSGLYPSISIVLP